MTEDEKKELFYVEKRNDFTTDRGSCKQSRTSKKKKIKSEMRTPDWVLQTEFPDPPVAQEVTFS